MLVALLDSGVGNVVESGNSCKSGTLVFHAGNRCINKPVRAGNTSPGVTAGNGVPAGPGHAAGAISGYPISGRDAHNGGDTLKTGAGQPAGDAVRVPGTHSLSGSIPDRAQGAADRVTAAGQPAGETRENNSYAGNNRHGIPAANQGYVDSRQPAAKGDMSPGDRWQTSNTAPVTPSSGVRTAATVQLPQLNRASGMTVASQMAQRMAAMITQNVSGNDVRGNNTRKAFSGNASPGVIAGNGVPAGQGHAVGAISGYPISGRDANNGGDTLKTGAHPLSDSIPDRAQGAVDRVTATGQPAGENRENNSYAGNNRHGIPAANQGYGDSRQPAAKGDISSGDRWQTSNTAPATPSSGVRTAATVQLPPLNWASGMTMASQMAQRMAAVITQNVYGNGIVSLRIKLQPERLGEVMVRLVYHRGSVQAHFVAANTQTKELLDQSMVQLRENLAQQNINLSDVSTSAGENSGSWARGDQHFGQSRQNLPGDFSGPQERESTAGTSQAEQMEDSNDNDHLNHLV